MAPQAPLIPLLLLVASLAGCADTGGGPGDASGQVEAPSPVPEPFSVQPDWQGWDLIARDVEGVTGPQGWLLWANAVTGGLAPEKRAVLGLLGPEGIFARSDGLLEPPQSRVSMVSGGTSDETIAVLTVETGFDVRHEVGIYQDGKVEWRYADEWRNQYILDVAVFDDRFHVLTTGESGKLLWTEQDGGWAQEEIPGPPLMLGPEYILVTTVQALAVVGETRTRDALGSWIRTSASEPLSYHEIVPLSVLPGYIPGGLPGNLGGYMFIARISGQQERMQVAWTSSMIDREPDEWVFLSRWDGQAWHTEPVLGTDRVTVVLAGAGLERDIVLVDPGESPYDEVWVLDPDRTIACRQTLQDFHRPHLYASGEGYFMLTNLTQQEVHFEFIHDGSMACPGSPGAERDS